MQSCLTLVQILGAVSLVLGSPLLYASGEYVLKYFTTRRTRKEIRKILEEKGFPVGIFKRLSEYNQYLNELTLIF